MKLIDFIKANPNWEDDLQKDPYNIIIKRKQNFIMFNYNQIRSDFHNPIVRECRGLILEDKTFRPLCVPFYKFANYGESYADDIDWNTAVVQEKIDGSIIKLWNYKETWNVSTNAQIDARDANLKDTITEYSNFYELFLVAAKNVNLDYGELDPDNTYMFELTSPFNKVVISHKDTRITHIGTRNNISLKEIPAFIGIRHPKVFSSLNTLSDCIKASHSLSFDKEGYVVVDAKYNRVKVKSPAYVAMHHLFNSTESRDKCLVTLIRQNEYEEFIVYYPEYEDDINTIKSKINSFIESLNISVAEAMSTTFETRKEFALFALKTIFPPFMFSWYDGKTKSASEWLWSQSDSKIIELIN